MPNIPAIQQALRDAKIDAWLFYDFRHRDPIAHRILGLPMDSMATRRWFYLVPGKGEPRKLVHRIESGMLDSLPGSKLVYASQDELRKSLPRLLARTKRVAMQYSPKNAIPYVSMVDAGTVELVRSFGRKIVSSADLVQVFEACWTPDQYQSHLEAGRIIDRVREGAFLKAAQHVGSGTALSEYELQQWVLEQFQRNNLATDEPPIVAVGAHAGDPHYEPKPFGSSPIREGDLLLLDLWGKLRSSGSVYYDITWMGYLGASVPDKYARAFRVVREARDRAVSFVRESVAKGRLIEGWQVDRAAREVIRKAGFAKHFVHRTGHSIGEDVHGNGANMDSLETQDVRRIIPRTCFSVEPGLYFADFGVRSEVNVYVDSDEARVTGAVQTEIIPLTA